MSVLKTLYFTPVFVQPEKTVRFVNTLKSSYADLTAPQPSVFVTTDSVTLQS